jgi:hypothetical protein
VSACVLAADQIGFAATGGRKTITGLSSLHGNSAVCTSVTSWIVGKRTAERIELHAVIKAAELLKHTSRKELCS